MADIVQSAGSWIYKMIMLLILGGIVITIVGVSAPSDINTIQVQKQLFLSRILYSPDSFWFTDDTVYTGIVDEDKFDQEWIDNNFNYIRSYGGAEIVLLDSNQREIKRIFINQPAFSRIKTESEASISGSGSLSIYSFPVIIKQTNQNGWMVVAIAMPVRT